MAADTIEDRLGHFLAAALGRDTVEARRLRRLSGGASRETWAFDLFDALDGATEPMILQRVRAGAIGSTSTMVGEAALLDAARSAGVPVAPVVAASDDREVIDAPFVVMGWVEGETIARRILRDERFATARARLVGQCAGAMAAIHRIPPSIAPHLSGSDPVAQLRGLLDLMGQPHPAFELGLRWLDDHRPTRVEPQVVHGDFRLGNLMVGDDGLVAVLDWELAHLGDPVEDLGWLCVRAWRFGSELPVAGVGRYADLRRAYESAAGTSVDAERLRWWEALGTLRWGVICVLQASSHLTGASRSVELAAIGRRVCENEYDLLRLIGARPDDWPPAAADAEVAPARPALHDAPSAAQLVEAVREFLEADVMAATEGRVQFHARVAARVLATVERELESGFAPAERHQARLAQLGYDDDAALAAAIRGGLAIGADVSSTVWEAVVAKVTVANPSYLQGGDQGPGGGETE